MSDNQNIAMSCLFYAIYGQESANRGWTKCNPRFSYNNTSMKVLILFTETQFIFLSISHGIVCLLCKHFIMRNVPVRWRACQLRFFCPKKRLESAFSATL